MANTETATWAVIAATMGATFFCPQVAIAQDWKVAGATAVTSQDGWNSSVWFVRENDVRACRAAGPDSLVCTAESAKLPANGKNWRSAGAASMREPGGPGWYSLAWFLSDNNLVAMCRNMNDQKPMCSAVTGVLK